MVATLPDSDSAIRVDRVNEVEPSAADALETAFRRQLDDPTLVVSDDYVGHDRRRSGLLPRLSRGTFGARRSLLRFEVAALIVVVLSGTITGLLVARGGPASAKPAKVGTDDRTTTRSSSRSETHGSTPALRVTPPAKAVPPATPAPPSGPATTSPPAGTAAAPAAATAAAAPAGLSPEQMGAAALALVRYPWQRIPGYSIQFEPISDAPSPGFYGNTTFTWGQPGGTSVLYVYPGETVDRLAGIIAFEIGHEVDAAAVEPQGGEAAIENALGIHPASWAPDCDCAEQGFLSGWYASAFSNYWSPGVGNWSQVAPEPTGAVLASIEPWLNPTISS